MYVSFDQSTTNTGAVAFTKRGRVKTTFKPSYKLKDHKRRQDLANQILIWLDDLERENPDDPVTHVILESFVKYVPDHKKYSMMILHAFTGYLIARLENWSHDRVVSIDCLSKGNTSKERVQLIAKGRGFTGNEHECDAYYLGLMAGFER